MDFTRQQGIDITGSGKVVGGDDHSQNHHHYPQQTKLAGLFSKLNEEFNREETIDKISDDLQRFINKRDTIGLEEKLKKADKIYLYENAMWLKEEYVKKLTTYQFFDTAQSIHSFLLGIVLERFQNRVYPKIRDKASDSEIMALISTEIVEPVVKIIEDQGCEDIMGLSSVEIQGMIYFLTGRCHIKWDI